MRAVRVAVISMAVLAVIGCNGDDVIDSPSAPPWALDARVEVTVTSDDCPGGDPGSRYTEFWRLRHENGDVYGKFKNAEIDCPGVDDWDYLGRLNGTSITLRDLDTYDQRPNVDCVEEYDFTYTITINQGTVTADLVEVIDVTGTECTGGDCRIEERYVGAECVDCWPCP
jgi:hypothetical protein